MARRKSIKNDFKEDPPGIIPEDVINAIVFFRTQRLPREKKVRIEVNAVDSPHRFFFNWLGSKNYSMFMETMDSLQFDYRSTNRVYAIPKSHLKMGMACVVKYSKVFFRGVVIDVNDDFVEVFTIDYGKKVITMMEDYDSEPLFWMRRKFKKMPCQAIPGQLYTVFPKQLNWTQESADFLLEQLADREVFAQVARYELPGETVSMSLSDPESEEVIELSLVSGGFAEFVGEKGLQMLDNEVIAQRIYDDHRAKEEAEELKKKAAAAEEARKKAEAVACPCPVPPGFELKDRREPAKPVTFDNMLEALEVSSSTSASSFALSNPSIASSCASQEDEPTTIEAGRAVSPIASLQSCDGLELSAAELPTALVRPSMRSEPCAASCGSEKGREAEVESLEEAEEFDESGSSSAAAVEQLLSIDASEIKDPQHRAWLREEMQREIEKLRAKMQMLDMQINETVASTASVVEKKQRGSNFNPEAAPFVPRSFLATSGSAESTISSGSAPKENAAGVQLAAPDEADVKENATPSTEKQEESSSVNPGISSSAPIETKKRHSEPPPPVVSAQQTQSNVKNSLVAVNYPTTLPPTTLAPSRNSVPFATSYFDRHSQPTQATLVANSVRVGGPKTHYPAHLAAQTIEPPPGMGFATPLQRPPMNQPSMLVMPPPGFNVNPVFMPQQFANYPAPFYPQPPHWS